MLKKIKTAQPTPECVSDSGLNERNVDIFVFSISPSLTNPQYCSVTG